MWLPSERTVPISNFLTPSPMTFHRSEGQQQHLVAVGPPVACWSRCIRCCIRHIARTQGAAVDVHATWCSMPS